MLDEDELGSLHEIENNIKERVCINDIITDEKKMEVKNFSLIHSKVSHNE